MLSITNFCRAPNPGSLSVFGRVRGKYRWRKSTISRNILFSDDYGMLSITRFLPRTQPCKPQYFFGRVRGKNSTDTKNQRSRRTLFFSDASGMLSITSFCRASNPASLSVLARVHGKNSTDGESQRSRGTSLFLMIPGCCRERVFAAHPTLQALVFLVGCAAKTLPMAQINDLEEHRIF